MLPLLLLLHGLDVHSSVNVQSLVRVLKEEDKESVDGKQYINDRAWVTILIFFMYKLSMSRSIRTRAYSAITYIRST